MILATKFLFVIFVVLAMSSKSAEGCRNWDRDEREFYILFVFEREYSIQI